MCLRAGTVEVANDGGHAGLVAHGGRQVDGLLGVILGEAVGKRVSELSGKEIKGNNRVFTYDLTFPR